MKNEQYQSYVIRDLRITMLESNLVLLIADNLPPLRFV